MTGTAGDGAEDVEKVEEGAEKMLRQSRRRERLRRMRTEASAQENWAKEEMGRRTEARRVACWERVNLRPPAAGTERVTSWDLWAVLWMQERASARRRTLSRRAEISFLTPSLSLIFGRRRWRWRTGDKLRRKGDGGLVQV